MINTVILTLIINRMILSLNYPMLNPPLVKKVKLVENNILL